MRDSKSFRQVVGVQVHMTYKKTLTMFFVSSIDIYRSKMVNYKEKFHLPRFQIGPTFSRGGVQLFPGRSGSNCLFPIETHISCDFPGCPNPLPQPLLWIRPCLRSCTSILRFTDLHIGSRSQYGWLPPSYLQMYLLFCDK